MKMGSWRRRVEKYLHFDFENKYLAILAFGNTHFLCSARFLIILSLLRSLEDRFHLGKTQINLVFLSVCTIFAARKLYI